MAENLNLGIIPDINDKSAPQPVPGEIRLSAAAIDARMRRIMKPRVDGSYKVSVDIVEQWRQKRKGRKSLEQLFQSCGYEPDRGDR